MTTPSERVSRRAERLLTSASSRCRSLRPPLREDVEREDERPPVEELRVVLFAPDDEFLRVVFLADDEELLTDDGERLACDEPLRFC